MAKGKSKHAKSEAFFRRVNGPDFDVKAATNSNKRDNRQYSNTRGGAKGGNGRNIAPTSTAPVTVPYNFIPLPQQVIPAEFYNSDYTATELIKAYRDHVNANDNHSGYIDITITTKTPLFIGGASNLDNPEQLEFYGGKDNPIIPGSTIKGMVKQIFKIITASAFRSYQRGSGLGDFEDRYLYFRDFASKIKPLKEYYMSKMMQEERSERGTKTTTKGTPGFIIKTVDNQYFAISSTAQKRSYAKDNLEYKKNAPSIEWGHNYVNIHTGKMNSKKSYMRIDKPGNFEMKRIPIPQKYIDSYVDDKNRGTLDLLSKSVAKVQADAKSYTKCEDVILVVPAYFTEQNGVVEHFGHGRYYRIAYDLSVSDHLPNNIKRQNDIVDLCDSVFGCGSDWAGRVSFGDAYIQGTPKMCAPDFPHPLMSPNPTSFQFYLEQDYTRSDQHKHWGHGDAYLRGYKMYWHQPIQKAEKWGRTEEEKAIKGTKKIRPVDRENVFKGRIHFTSLSTIELGALLMTLNLNKSSKSNQITYYKLGMGKSIGLGSIQLDTEVTMFNFHGRYTRLFDSQQWSTGAERIEINDYVKAFQAYCYDVLGGNEKEYKAMLDDLYLLMDWNIANGSNASTKWAEATKMMSVDKDPHKRFRERTKLGGPKAFLDRWK